MEERQIQIIMKGDLKTNRLVSQKEKEIALKILSELKGTSIIRANSILNFCQEALQHSVSSV